MQTHPWFQDWFNSPYYHQLYFNRDEKEAGAFIDKLIDCLKPAPDARMLDVACGRGRHSIYLASKGFDVTGIDLSESSIQEALKYETEKLHFCQHDMRLPFWINYFDHAFNFFTSFGYFKTRREHDDSIRTIAQSVKHGGSFTLDYLNVEYVEEHFVSTVEKEIEGAKYHITKWMDDTHFYKKIKIEDSALREPIEYTEQVMKFSLDDLTQMFSRQNLRVQQVFGDYDFCGYDVQKSPRMILIARKD